MNHKLRSLAVLGVVSAVAASHAVVFDLNFVYTGATPGGSAPWVRVTVNDVAANKVNLKIEHLSGSAAGQFISNVYLNLNPLFGSMSISNEVNSNKRSGALTFGNQSINGGGQRWDMRVAFETSNSGGGVNRLKPNELWSADLSASGLSAANFLDTNDDGSYAGAHLQGIAGGLSSHISSVVPEPTSVAALAIGAVGLFLRRRKKA